MASYTPNLELYMKDPVADGADTFNIQTMLNENWEKIDRQVLRAMAAAAAYDAGKTYQQGDYCTQGGLLYRANQTIAQPEAWTAGHWTAISITDVIRGLTAADVGAAPDGFGLGGEAALLTSADDVNSIWKCGWYKYISENMPQNAVAPSWLNIMRVDAASSGAFVQTVFGISDNANYQITPIVRRMIYADKITPFEYVNPPMMLGVEYRTTERYQGKPVYKKAVNFGLAPNTTYKEVAHGITDFSQLVVYSGMLGGANLVGHPFVSSVHINVTTIRIETTADASGSYIYVILSYTKTSD